MPCKFPKPFWRSSRKRRALWYDVQPVAGAAPTQNLIGNAKGTNLLNVPVCWIAMWLAVQELPPPAGPQQEFYQDFRAGKPQHPALKWSGLDGGESIEPEERGSRIRLPATRMRTSPAGAEFALAGKGDFEVTAGYELVGTDPPITARGIGFEL